VKIWRWILLGIVVLLLAVWSDSQAVRPGWSASLDGSWQFLPDAAGARHRNALPTAGWRVATVPMSIQAQFADLRDFAGTAWFRRQFPAPALAKGERLLLHFGAVDYQATVWVNGIAMGGHEGGYTPFDLDITGALRAGENTVLVKVHDPRGKAAYAQIPHGKQDWYVQTTGLWQSVRLEAKPAAYLEWAHALTPGGRLSGFALRLAHAKELPPGARARVTVTAPDGAAIVRSFALARQTAQTLALTLSGAPQRWSPAHPRLYSFRIALSNGDALAGRFGLRTIAVRNGEILLNGKRLYLRGALDQDFYPDGVYTPPSAAYELREMRLAKALGLNLLRLHIKVPDPRYLDAADEAGVLIWYEIPNWDTLTPLAEARAKETLREATARDWNHPSLVLQSIINESWGADLKQAADRKWLLATSEWARQLLPDRLVVDNSACCSNFHLKSDLADFHNYNSLPDHAAAWDAWVKSFASRPKWLYSPYGDAQPEGKNGLAPLVVSEFGNWGLPPLPAQRPWWFTRGSAHLTRPAGVRARMRAAGVARVFGGYATLAQTTETHEWHALRHEIESIRMQAAIQGYVITEFTDVNWENNGLLTMWREPKNFHADLAALQKSVVVIAQPDRHDYAPGGAARVALYVSNESPATIRGAKLELNGQTWALPPIVSGAVVKAATAAVPIELEGTGRQPMRMRLTAADGTVLDARMRQLTVIWAGHAAPEGVTIAHTWAEAAQAAANGGNVLLEAAAPMALPSGLSVVSRKGNLGGDWISNFNWIDTNGPAFEPLASLGPMMGPASSAITPQVLIAGVPAADSGDVLGGFFLGFVHQARATVLQVRHGRGKIVITTLALGARADPFAAAVRAALQRYLASPACKPGLSL
jgi:hypothetical protein